MEMGRMSRVYENNAFGLLKPEYDYLFKASSVCDFIGIKDGILYLIEYKREGGRPEDNELRPIQKQVKSLVGDKYRVFRHD